MKKNKTAGILQKIKFRKWVILAAAAIALAVIIILILSRPELKFNVVIGSTYGTNTINEDLSAYPVGLDKSYMPIYSWYRNNKPFAVLNMPFERNGKNLSRVKDYSGYGYDGVAYSAVYNKRGGYEKSGAYDFGEGYIEIPDRPEFSPKNNELTIAFWMKPATFDFFASNLDSNSMSRLSLVSKLEKNDFYNAEWNFVLYNRTAVDGDRRPKRISFYAYSISAALGTGSYFQDDLMENEWIHVVGVINKSSTAIYKNGVLRDSDRLSEYNVKFLANGNATLRIGGLNGGTNYNGSIDDLIIFNRSLSDDEITALYNGRYNFISGHELAKGDIWKACITPNDGHNDGKRVCSNNILVAG